MEENPKPKYYPRKLEDVKDYFVGGLKKLNGVIQRFRDEVQDIGMISKDLVLGMNTQKTEYATFIDSVSIEGFLLLALSCDQE